MRQDHSTQVEQVLELAREKGLLRAGDLRAEGLPREYLSRLARQGRLERVARGLYRLPDTDVSEHHSLAVAMRQVPHGIVCLLSALQFHGMTTQNPFEVWMAIANKARRPAAEGVLLHVVYLSEKAFTSGVEAHLIEGVTVRVYTPAKTVADCFKFRNKIGLDVALEALQDYRHRADYSADDLWHYARLDRVANVMRPYMEALL